jgi:hypothetical protein
MGNDHDKEKRHQHRHDGHDGSLAASDDIRDVHAMTEDELKKWEAEHDKQSNKGKKKSEHEEKDISARVINIEVVGNRTKVGFGVDPKKVHDGMTALLMRGDALLAMTGLVVDASNHYAYGFVDLTPDMIQQAANHIVINPSSIPKSASPHPDIKARLVGVSVVGGKTQIMIGMGTSHGVRAGMDGYCMDEGGKYHVGSRFHITEVGSMHAKAIVDLTVDEVYHLSLKEVMVNPKQMP